MIARVTIIGVGVLVGVYGLVLLLQQGLDNLIATAKWLVGGVVLHDFVWAPLVLLAAYVGARLLRHGRQHVVIPLTIIVLVTISALPAILSYGAKPDNPTLLPRNYTVGWLVMVAVVILGYAAVVGVRRLQARH